MEPHISNAFEGLQEYGLPQRVKHAEEVYSIEIIRKELPTEFPTQMRKMIKVDSSRLLEFVTVILFPSIAITFFLAYPEWIRIVGIWASILVGVLLPSVWYTRLCRNSKEKGKVYFPTVKVADDKNVVVTTMTPKAYVSNVELADVQHKSPMLPFIVLRVVTNPVFDKQKFEKALENALVSRKRRMEMKPE